ncbi:MBL fold metallo-hydrolase [Vallitalea guaymasensis]|uniref:MBL fold metallo-hydrolase n=1 Tax=Vallitalea guaymasensis TaxID=1185412 RepID=UPI002729BE18|nr:MBL fold metallo-hydrolase [Vallitalea guaymasensis]
MKDLTFYGTSAAEGIPSPFCDCYLCRNAREKGGKEVRKRSMFRINEEITLDLGADSFVQAIMYGDFINLEHVLVTHTHEDHFAYMMMNVRNMATHRIDRPLNYYMTDKAYDILEFYRKSKPILKGCVNELIERNIIAFHRLEFGHTYKISNIEVTPLKGNHYGNMQENSANYIVKLPNGKILFYGLDTGYYLDETFEALKKYHIDYYISECTFGTAKDRGLKPDGHLDVDSCKLVFKNLLEQHTIDEDTKIYLTHINHCHLSTHEDLVEIFDNTDLPCEINVAYDGMSIED